MPPKDWSQRSSAPADGIAGVRRAAAELGAHPQDHGWREFYRLLVFGLDRCSPALTSALESALAAKADSGATHLVTMFGIAVKAQTQSESEAFDAALPAAQRLAALDRILQNRSEAIVATIATRQNSFTSARRFLLPQVLLSAYFHDSGHSVRFADVGTGLGILPAQLNARRLYERFAPDLKWPMGVPRFRPIPLTARFGLDREPLPDRDWVRACYGPSGYYREMYRELIEAWDHPQVRDAEVAYLAVDLLDTDRLVECIRHHRINAVNLSYVLYEVSAEKRCEVVEAIRESLAAPGVVTITEPERELTRPGCTVLLADAGRRRPWRLLHVSDGHFRGRVTPLDDYRAFNALHPIA